MCLISVLPELPIPGPSAAGPLNAGTNLFYHSSVAEQASNALLTTDGIITQQILQALVNTPTDYVELNQKNITAVSHNNGVEQPVVPNCNLSNALYHRNSSLFVENTRNVGASGQSTQGPSGSAWREQPFANDNSVGNSTYSANNAYNQQLHAYSNNHQSGGGGDVIVPGEIGCNQPNSAKFGQNQLQSNNMLTNNQLNDQPDDHPGQQDVTRSLRDFRKGSTPQSLLPNHAPNAGPSVNDTTSGTNGNAEFLNHLGHEKVVHNSSVSKSEIKEEVTSDSNTYKNDTKCKISVPKLSNDDVEQTGQSINSYSSHNPKQAEELGMATLFSKRSTRSSSQLQNTNNISMNNKSGDSITNNIDGGSDGMSDDEDSTVKGRKNKFFRASEAQRIEELQRKRKAEDNTGAPENFGKRRRQKSPSPEKEELKPFVPKKVTRRIEKKLAPMLVKIDAEELMDSNMFVRFNKTVDLIFENMEDVNMKEFEDAERNAKDNEGSELPPEILIPKYQLQDLASETAKLKSLEAMESIPNDKLVKLLNILELNIRDGSKVIPLPTDGDDDEDDDKMWLELAMERVTRAADSSLTVLHILTSKNMAKCVYIDDVIDRVVLFLRFQLSNTIYPSYDPVYKEISKKGSGYMGNMKKKRNYAAMVKDKNIIGLYSKCRELTDLLGDLVKMTILTDTTVLHVSTIGKHISTAESTSLIFVLISPTFIRDKLSLLFSNILSTYRSCSIFC